MIKVGIDTRQLRLAADKLAGFDRQERAIGINIGVKKIAAQGATVAKRAITADYNVKSAEVGRRMHITADMRNMQATINTRPRKYARGPGSNRIPLIEFSARDTKKTGVKFKIRKGGGQSKLRHAFIATMPNGHRGVFQRVPGTKKIREVVGIDVPQMVVGHRVLPKVVARINEVGPRVLLHELEYRLKRLGFR
ncbi:MAG: phage tail protein [Acidovorax sp.]|nr:phage tail protein [Acidovorax sp.]